MISRDGNKGGPLYFIEDSKTKKIPKNEITINLKQDFKANSHDIGRWVFCVNFETIYMQVQDILYPDTFIKSVFYIIVSFFVDFVSNFFV